ncbi:2-phosphosulfolactate phosphatase [Porphyromonadaceae bacterium W3.11]|nr:2-phosphosulfolactate phosphatase [Porphyromonadaceae bacterium W3.11]
MKLPIDIIPSPELIGQYPQKNSVAVVIDVLRASSTIITALQNGAKAIYPLETVEEAESFAKKGSTVGAERNVVRCPFAKFGNDPFEYTPETTEGETIYFTTTNGTRTIKSCIEAGHQVVIGSFINLSAVANYCRDKNVLAVCAGWKGKPAKEDTLFAAALLDALSETHTPVTDVSEMFVELWRMHKGQLMNYTKESNHYPRMVAAGKDNSYEYCMTLDLSQTLPIATVQKDGMICITT